ncbi:cytochrome c oxidase assembly protein [Yunchengibacter salinarum]|uniref:cytochrome c oxidase assembly protein n=1 Tax=Yunchengibacter salinarum TaxID=3133399 RepID=UPI0035B5E0A6
MTEALARKNGRVALIVGGVVAAMVALSFAAVPLYDLFCRVTGYGGTTQTAGDRAGPQVTDRDVTIRFASNTHRDMPWRFKPKQNTQSLKVGEKTIAVYEAYNPTDRTITGTATYNVTPLKAGSYFIKVDCFCFTEQTLKPGERVDMPVIYYIDPALADDPEMGDVTEVTLSYTFFVKETG